MHGNPVLNTVYWTEDRPDAFCLKMAEQAGLGSIGETEGFLDSNDDSLGGFFDGDGSDEGLFG